MSDLRQRVEHHLLDHLGAVAGRAAVSFLGAEPIDVLRFGPDPTGLVRYATVGMSVAPMTDAAADHRATSGPRAELVLSLRGRQDGVLRSLATLAASPAVEGLVVRAGAGLDLGGSLWPGARFTAVLVGEPGGLVPGLPLGGDESVQFLPVFPMTALESAWKRVHGAQVLEQAWLAAGLDLRDPARAQVPDVTG